MPIAPTSKPIFRRDGFMDPVEFFQLGFDDFRPLQQVTGVVAEHRGFRKHHQIATGRMRPPDGRQNFLGIAGEIADPGVDLAQTDFQFGLRSQVTVVILKCRLLLAQLQRLFRRMVAGFDGNTAGEAVFVAMPKFKVGLRVFPAKIAIPGVEINEPKAFRFRPELFNLLVPGFDEFVHFRFKPRDRVGLRETHGFQA
jgi:hypothetical protein